MATDRIVDGRIVSHVGTWRIDPIHSDLRITARHLMVAKVRGTFEDLDATIVVAEDPRQSTVEIEAKAASVTTGTRDRDEHLRSADFLDAEQHPLITFKSTALPGRKHWRLTGDLTIRGVTRPGAVRPHISKAPPPIPTATSKRVSVPSVRSSGGTGT